MPDDVNPLSRLLASQPIALRRRRQRALETAQSGAYDVERRMDTLANRVQRSTLRAGYNAASADDESGLHRAKPKSRKLAHRDRVTPYATVAISYVVRDRRLYFYRHDPTYYVDAYARGVITRGEFDTIASNVELMRGG